MKKEESTKFLKLCLAEALIRMMQEQSYESINISAVCERAGVGRTTYYRHFDTKGGKEELLVFKLVSEWKSYEEKHREEKEKDWTKLFLSFVYENRELLRLMYRSGLVTAIMRAFDEFSGWKEEKNSAYLRAFFVYGFFGVVYQWIRYDFDETPEQIVQHTAEAVLSAAREKSGQPGPRAGEGKGAGKDAGAGKSAGAGSGG